MTLYEIKDTYLNFLSAIESGEIPEEAIADTLESIQGEFDEKADNIAAYIKNLLTESDGITAEITNLTKRKKAKINKATNLQNYLYNTMKALNKSKIETARNAISIKTNPPKVEIEDEEAFIHGYKDTYCKTKVEIKIDKAKVKEALNNGEIIGFAKLVQDERLAIK